ncbi:MAG: ribonuclease E inhibitor RraB [Alteromonadales bacterium]|nr:ribonuclease E inhibitor RraB [Alteromonadales bacterium]
MKEIPGKTITPESLVEMFQNIENKTKWNMSGNMLWGYFFTHHEPKKLEQAASVLAKQGYKVVNIYLSDKEEPNEPDLYWLHVENIETHSPKSLDKRNDKLYIFANEFGLDSYDGMDVGPVTH